MKRILILNLTTNNYKSYNGTNKKLQILQQKLQILQQSNSPKYKLVPPSIAIKWPSTIEYQPGPPYTDQVPPSVGDPNYIIGNPIILPG